uniref:TIL domain-containing protein n=1 Tax=Caenorhabditis tropicalis TaxID=1561998 RepID=A0A1I7TYX0_9PELO
MKFFILLAVLVFFVSTGSAQYGQACPPNEVFRSCGTACEPTCQNPKPSICTLQCIVDVCQCKQGFVRGDNGCVEPWQCNVYGK